VYSHAGTYLPQGKAARPEALPGSAPLPPSQGVRHCAEMAGCVVLVTATAQALSLRPLHVTETAFSKAPGGPDPFAGGSGAQPSRHARAWDLGLRERD